MHSVPRTILYCTAAELYKERRYKQLKMWTRDELVSMQVRVSRNTMGLGDSEGSRTNESEAGFGSKKSLNFSLLLYSHSFIC